MRCSNPPNEPPRLVVVLSAVSVAWLAACGPPRYTPVAPPPSDPTAVLDVVREREKQIRSLRGSFKATASYGSGKSDVQGVLLVRKPDRFRMRLMLTFGITVLDYVSHGDRAWTLLPLANGDGGQEAQLFSPADVRQTFLRGPAAFPGACTATRASADVVEVACRACDDCPVLRSLRLDRRSATIIEETSWDDGTVRLTIRYGDYREVAGLPLPFHVVMAYPARHLKVEIGIRSYEVSPQLADALFEPPRSGGRGSGAEGR